MSADHLTTHKYLILQIFGLLKLKPTATYDEKTFRRLRKLLITTEWEKFRQLPKMHYICQANTVCIGYSFQKTYLPSALQYFSDKR